MDFYAKKDRFSADMQRIYDKIIKEDLAISLSGLILEMRKLHGFSKTTIMHFLDPYLEAKTIELVRNEDGIEVIRKCKNIQ